MTRYLEIQAPGVMDWMTEPVGSPAQTVFAGLARMQHSAALVPASLAQAFDLDLKDFSRALFELNRRNSLRVTSEAFDHGAQFHFDFDALCEDLTILSTGKPQLMLVTAEGLCLAQQGLPEEVCTRQAARCHLGPEPEFAVMLPLYLGSRKIWLCSREEVDRASTAWLRLVRRLLSLDVR